MEKRSQTSDGPLLFSDKDLVEIGCQCKGTMARCHTECLVEWANAQQSAVCEICQTEYPGVEARTVSRTRSCSRSFRASTSRTLECTNQREKKSLTRFVRFADLQFIPNCCGGKKPTPNILLLLQDVLLECNTRRFWFVIITVFLIFCTIVSAILLHFVENEYLQSFPPAFVHNRVVVSNFKFSFGVTLTLFIFCLVMFVVVLIVWVISECFFWPQQRMLLRVQRFQVVPTDDDDTTSFVMTNRHRTSPRTREIARRWRTTSL